MFLTGLEGKKQAGLQSLSSIQRCPPLTSPRCAFDPWPCLRKAEGERSQDSALVLLLKPLPWWFWGASGDQGPLLARRGRGGGFVLVSPPVVCSWKREEAVGAVMGSTCLCLSQKGY